MKPVLFLAAAGLTLAQNFSGQPDCATACLSSAISAAGCKGDDIGCQCGPSQAKIAATAAPCLVQSCGTLVLQAQSAGEAQCKSYFATAATHSATTTGTESGTTASATTTSSTESITSSTVTTITGTLTSLTTSTGTNAEGSQTKATMTSVFTTTSTSTSTGGAAGVMATPAIMGAGALLGVLGAAAL
ncbi:hypothetical protein VTI74DRAFT_2496 [Chaetomium olivicolor]